MTSGHSEPQLPAGRGAVLPAAGKCATYRDENDHFRLADDSDIAIWFLLKMTVSCGRSL
jgi:hypothetical protein